MSLRRSVPMKPEPAAILDPLNSVSVQERGVDEIRRILALEEEFPFEQLLAAAPGYSSQLLGELGISELGELES